MKKGIKWIFVSVAAVGIIAYFIYSSTKPLETELLEVKPKTVSQSFNEEGIVVPAIERSIYSEMNGKINELHVKEGQKLKKGEVIAEIDTEDLDYQLQQLQGQKNSLLGQGKMNDEQDKLSKEEIKRQIGQLKGQLESLKGQEKQAAKNPYDADLKRQELAMEETERQLELANEDYTKKEQLFNDGLIAKQELDIAQNKMDELENTLLQQEQGIKLIEEQTEPQEGTDQYYSGLKNAIQTQITILEKELKRDSAGSQQYNQGLIDSVNAQMNQLHHLKAKGQVRSPISGVVKEIHLEEGDMTTTQSPILTGTSTKDFEIEVYILTEDVLYVKEGMKVSLIQKRRNGDFTFGGKVKGIAPAAEEKMSALGLTEQRIKVTITPDKHMPELRPGYAIDASFTTLEQKDKLAVPKVCLFPVDNEDAVFVVKDGKAVIQKVEKGMETNELVVIEKGIEAGNQVIKNPQEEGLEVGKMIEPEF